jgi:huntingtin
MDLVGRSFFHLSNRIDLPLLLNYLLQSLTDSSGIRVKMVCKALGRCLKALTNMHSCSLYKENGTWSSQILKSLLSIVTEDTYWLVKIEVLNALAKADYRVIHFLEESTIHNVQTEQDDSIQSAIEKDSIPFAGIDCIQTQILDFIIQYLGDNDPRVRNCAASVLVSLIPKLWFNLQVEQARVGNSIVDIRETISKV